MTTATAPTAASEPGVQKTSGAHRSCPPILLPETIRRIERYVTHMSPDRAAPYGSWSEVIFAIINIAHTHRSSAFITTLPDPNVIAWAHDLCHTFSKLAPHKYEKDRVDAFLATAKARGDDRPKIGISGLKRRYEEDGAGSGTLSEAESEETAPKPKRVSSQSAILDVAFEIMRALGNSLAVCEEELLWFRHGRWRRVDAKELGNFMGETEDRRELWSAHVLQADRVLKALDIAVASVSGHDVVKMRGEFVKEDLSQRTVGKLSFSDLCYDFQSRETTPVNPENTGMCVMKRPFPIRNEDVIAEVMLFISDALPDGMDRRVFLHTVARAIAGHVEDGTFLMLVGPAANAKSTIINFIVSAFSGVCSRFSGGHLASRRTDDVERANAWLSTLEGRRLCLSDEIVTDTLNGHRIKMAALGDVVSVGARRLYNESRPIVITSTFAAAVNKVPTITPLDDGVRRRIVIVPFDVVFVPEGDKRLGDENDPHVRLAQKNKSKEIRRNDTYHDALFYILADAYHDNPYTSEDFNVIYRMREEIAVTEDVNGQHEDAHITPETAVKKAFDFTGDSNDFLVRHEIRSAVERHGYKTDNYNVLYALLASFGAVSGGGNKRVRHGQADRYFTGVKLR